MRAAASTRVPNPRVIAVVITALCLAATAAAIRTTTGAASSAVDRTPSVAPSRGRILFQSLAPGGGDTLYTMKQSGADVQRLRLKVPGSAISPDWSSDGKRVAFAVQVGNSQSIWTADANGRNATEVFHCAHGCLGTDYPAWSPDGRSIAFTYYDADPPPTTGPPSGDSIRVVDLHTRKVRVVVRSQFPQLADLARWSPDGKQLVIQRDRFASDGSETGCRIEIVRVSDGRVRPLTPFAQFAFHPDWSSKGDLIEFDTYDLLAFRDSAPDASNLFTVRSDGSHLRQLTHFRPGGDRISAATFTPDGRRIMFTYQVGGSRKAGIIKSGGGAIETVPTNYSGPVTHPRMS
jgi:Tol biopolymer transport system component